MNDAGVWAMASAFSAGAMIALLIAWALYPRGTAVWVVADAQGARFRAWGDWGPCWTDDRRKALCFARREDAEAFCRDDEDAWRVLPMVVADDWIYRPPGTSPPAPPMPGRREPLMAQGKRYERAVYELGEEWALPRAAVLARLDSDSRYVDRHADV